MTLTQKILSILLSSIFALSACSKTADTNTLKVGTIAGPETEIMLVAQQVAKKENGLYIKVIPFTDYSIPNEALSDGSIDANAFQHAPYLEESIAKRHYKIIAIGKTFIYPMGLYSSTIKQLDQLANNSLVAIPNDASNSARALLLLQSAKLITLKPNTSTLVTLADIAENPKNLQFKEIDTSQLPRTLPDVALAAINTNYAMNAGLLPSKDALFVENPSSPYANLVVIRQENETDPRIKQLIAALHSDPVLKKAKELFKDQAIPAWK